MHIRVRSISSFYGGPLPETAAGSGMQNLHTNRNEESRARRAAENSHDWIRFR